MAPVPEGQAQANQGPQSLATPASDARADQPTPTEAPSSPTTLPTTTKPTNTGATLWSRLPKRVGLRERVYAVLGRNGPSG